MGSLQGDASTAQPVDAAHRFRAGTIVVDSASSAGRDAPRSVSHPLGVPDHPWSLAGVVVSGRVICDASHAAALDAALRGADVVVDVDPGLLPCFLDDVRRLQIPLRGQWPAECAPRGTATGGSSADWGPLLAALAAGDSVEQAARRCHISVRSAHRRLAQARVALGVPSTATAVALWAAG